MRKKKHSSHLQIAPLEYICRDTSHNDPISHSLIFLSNHLLLSIPVSCPQSSSSHISSQPLDQPHHPLPITAHLTPLIYLFASYATILNPTQYSLPNVAIRYPPAFQHFSQVLIFSHHIHPPLILYNPSRAISSPLAPFLSPSFHVADSNDRNYKPDIVQASVSMNMT